MNHISDYIKQSLTLYGFEDIQTQTGGIVAIQTSNQSITSVTVTPLTAPNDPIQAWSISFARAVVYNGNSELDLIHRTMTYSVNEISWEAVNGAMDDAVRTFNQFMLHKIQERITAAIVKKSSIALEQKASE